MASRGELDGFATVAIEVKGRAIDFIVSAPCYVDKRTDFQCLLAPSMVLGYPSPTVYCDTWNVVGGSSG